MTGTTVSHYRILEKLGKGGMGVVYKAEDTELNRLVALKFLAAPPGTPRQPQGDGPAAVQLDSPAVERFQQEARAAAALNHPNICTIYEIGKHEGQLFIAMELVEGVTLSTKLKHGPLPVEEAIECSRQIADALEEAHEHRIVHRDLKPANVMLTAKGRVKILDFGLAKLLAPIDPEAPTEEGLLHSRAGTIMGTVPYMAPEQLRGEAVDARTDLYAFGALFYEMATGQRPFPEVQAPQLIAAILSQTPSPPRELNPAIPPELESIILRAMAKNPRERYQSAWEVLVDLPERGSASSSSQLRSAGVTRAAASVAARTGFARRRRTLLAAAGLAAAALAAFVFLAIPALQRPARTAPGSAPGSLPAQKQLAVLPFSAIGGGANEVAFSRGLAETLTAKLTQLSTGRSLQVVPVGDLLAQHVTTPEAAAKVFRVNLVLTGSLERAGNRIRVTYALVDPATDRQLRAATLTLADSDPFGIEDRVVEGMTGMLGLSVAPSERQAVESHGTQAAAAFRDYLQGLGYMQNYETAENLDKAVSSFRSALKADSAYALAYAGMGQAYWQKYVETRDTQWVDQAQQACGHAVALDAKLPASHLCLGTLENGTGQYARAIQEFRRVLEIDPTNIQAFGGLGGAQAHLKRISEAEETYRRAVSVRPNYWAPYNWLGVLYVEIGDNKKGAAMFKKVTELEPGNHMGFYNLGAADYMLGNWPEAEAMFRKSLELHPSAAAYSNLGAVTFYEGHYDEAAAYFLKAIQFTPKDPQLWGNLADAYKWSHKDRAKAVPTYEKAAELARESLSVNPRAYDVLGELAMYEAQSANINQALQEAQRALKLAPNDPAFLYNVSMVYRLDGQQAIALHFLGQALSFGYPVQAIRADPEWADLRNDPEFQKLISNPRQQGSVAAAKGRHGN